jgi:hypothetical protein
MVLKMYVKYLLLGAFFAEQETKEIKTRDVKLALKMMPKDCYAFSFYDVVSVKKDGENLQGSAKNHSGLFYPDAEKIHWSDIPPTPANSILISNIKTNGFNGYGIKTRTGNWQWLEKDDRFISSDISPIKVKIVEKKKRRI